MNGLYTFALLIIVFWIGRRTSHIALIDIAAAIVNLEEEPAVVAVLRRHAAMPDVGDKQARISRPGQ